MKKRVTLALVVVQSIIMLLLLMYAFVQKAEAEKQLQQRESDLMKTDSLMIRVKERERKMMHVIDSLVTLKAN